MQMTSLQPNPAYDRVAAQRLLNDLAVDLSRHDAQLESMVDNGNSVGTGWGEWFDQAAHDLLQGRDAYMALNPSDHDLAARMGEELIDLGHNGGRIASAFEDGSTLAYGWRSALDDTVSVVREAADRLHAVPTRPPVTPPTHPPVGSGVIADAAHAAKLARRSLETIGRIPANDTGTAATKDARIAAYELNMQAQKVIEQYFGDGSTPGYDAGGAQTLSELRRADAHLEDANWQLAKKPSPDGRFNGVDIPGAQRDTSAAVRVLEDLVSALSTGS